MISPRMFGWLMMVFASLNFALMPTTADELKFSDCPAAVQKTLQREANGAEITVVQADTEDGETLYGAEVTIDGRRYEIVVDDNGTLLEKALNEVEDTEEVELSDCPSAVQKTLKREANGTEIETVDKETKSGKSVYEAAVVLDGNNYKIRVAEDGILISKALEEEEEQPRLALLVP